MAYNDIFIEQLVVIESTAKTKLIKIFLWIVAILLSAGFIALSFLKPSLAFILLLLSAGLLYGAYYLCNQLNIEFEYIITNGDIDIDRIVNKSKRQRMATFNCSAIEKIEKYNSKVHNQSNEKNKRIYHGCTPNENSIAITVRHPKGGVYVVVISPDDNFKEAMKKYLSYNLKTTL